MNREDIIRMAKEADLWMTSDERIAAVERFAQAAYAAGAAAERQNICKHIAMLHDSLALASNPGGLKMRGNK